MTLISDMTDKKLIDTYLSYYQIVEMVECYSSSDLQYFYACEEELTNRDYDIIDRGEERFPKIVKVSEDEIIREKVIFT